nr:MAG TPA: hypothetical protein [Caudoviricetes sp.]
MFYFYENIIVLPFRFKGFSPTCLSPTPIAGFHRPLRG